MHGPKFQRQFYDALSGELAFAKISAATVVALLGQDVCTAAFTATNAVENNAILMAVGAGLAIYEVYEIYQTYEREGAKAALQKVAMDGTITIVTVGTGKVVLRVAEISAPAAELAWQSYLSNNPAFAQVVSKFMAPVKHAAAKAQSYYNQADEALEKGASKLYHKVFGRKGSSTTVEGLDLADTSKKLIHKNSLDYTGPTHVYKITNSKGTYKIGESAQGMSKYGQSRRAERQARKLQRETGEDHKSEVLAILPGKREARRVETELIQNIRNEGGSSTLPGNKGIH